MQLPKMIFPQLMEWIHPQTFRRCVQRYGGDYKVRSFSCWDQFLCMAFGQLTFRESLRDIEVCLRAQGSQVYHLGIRSAISRSTLADANESRDWRIYADLAAVLIARARRLYVSEELGLEFANTVYALDSTTIDLCLSLFPWANFRSTKAAIKLHTLLDLRGAIPSFIRITEGATHDVNILDDLALEAGAFYVMDRGYCDFARLFLIHQAKAFFFTRAKDNLRFVRHQSRPVDYALGVRSDQIGRLRGYYSRKAFPDHLRLIHYYDAQADRYFRFLTNHLDLLALSVCQLYKLRWQIELFFKWIKQHLCIKRFLGTSLNAVKTQIWIAICVYVLVAIIRKELNIEMSLHSILQVLSVHPFENVPLHRLLAEPAFNILQPVDHTQMLLWELQPGV
jgi:hypothetical protein